MKHTTMEEMFKSAEWYEKKAHTQLQSSTEKLVEQAGNAIAGKGGEVSSLFASELNHASRMLCGAEPPADGRIGARSV